MVGAAVSFEVGETTGFFSAGFGAVVFVNGGGAVIDGNGGAAADGLAGVLFGIAEKNLNNLDCGSVKAQRRTHL